MLITSYPCKLAPWRSAASRGRLAGALRLMGALVLSAVIAACGGDSDSITGGGGGGDTDTDTSTGGGGSNSVVRIGSGTGTSFSEGSLSASATALQSGGSATITVNFVDGSGAAISEVVSVEFTSDCVANGLASFNNPVVSTVSGLGTSTYTSAGCSGSDQVTATAVVGTTTLVATVDLTIAADQVLSVEFVSSSVAQLSLAGIGGNETTQVVFRLVGAQAAPIVGEAVSFATSTTAGGITLATGTDTAVSDNNGLVTTVLQSGTVAGPVSIIATHDATGIQGISEDIVISTGVPVARRFSLALSQFNPPRAFDTNGVTVTVSIIASDQFGNDAPDGTRVSFVSPESGNIDSSCTLVSGECAVVWRSSSPRDPDLRATILAYTDGAEDFTDNNGNNVFDGADTFDPATQDLAEAFADENENEAYDVGEFFVNANAGDAGDSGRDDGDGVWNGPCLTGVDASALCPGADSVTISKQAVIVMPTDTARLVNLGSFGAPGSTLDIAAGPTFFGGLVVADSNTNADSLGGNPMPEGTTISFETTNGSITGNASFVVRNAISPTGSYGLTLEPDDTPDSGTLTLTITAPGADANLFTWIVSD